MTCLKEREVGETRVGPLNRARKYCFITQIALEEELGPVYLARHPVKIGEFVSSLRKSEPELPVTEACLDAWREHCRNESRAAVSSWIRSLDQLTRRVRREALSVHPSGYFRAVYYPNL